MFDSTKALTISAITCAIAWVTLGLIHDVPSFLPDDPPLPLVGAGMLFSVIVAPFLLFWVLVISVRVRRAEERRSSRLIKVTAVMVLVGLSVWGIWLTLLASSHV